MLRICQRHSIDDEIHASGQTRISLKEKKRHAEHRFRQQMVQAHTKLDARNSYKPNTPPMQQDVDIRISWQQELGALRAEIVRLKDQTCTMEKLEKEVEELQTENQSLRQHMLNQGLSTTLSSSFEHSTGQNEITSCPSDPSTPKKANRPQTRLPLSNPTSFAFNRLPRTAKPEYTAQLQRKWWSPSCLFARKSTRRPAFDLGDRRSSKMKCNGLQKKCHELAERNHLLQETNEATRHMLAQRNQQIVVLQQRMRKLVEAVKRLHRQSIRLSWDLSENPSSLNAVVDWSPIQHTSGHNDGTWTGFQQIEDDCSELSAFPIVSLEFTPTQRIDI